jgi:hypothetical protein
MLVAGPFKIASITRITHQMCRWIAIVNVIGVFIFINYLALATRK